jgi:3-oxoacyl-[acyl-carrier-protein] synthase-3
VAAAVPETGTPSEETERRLGLEPGWIERRTGVRFVPQASTDQATSDLAIAAGRQAIERAEIQAADIKLLLLATSTPDHLLPPTAPLVAQQLGLTQAGAIDLAGACAGFLYGVTLGGTYAHTLQAPVLVIGANILTRRVRQDDPATAALFGDGAGAVVLMPSTEPHVLGSYLGADGSRYDDILIPAGGSREPLSAESLAQGRHLMTIQRGKGLFRHAARMMADAGMRALAAAGMTSDVIDWWIPHQANLRMMQESGRLLGIPEARTIAVVDRYANSSAATIPIALDHAVRCGRVKRGDVLLLTAVGAGMLSGGLVVRF